MSSTNRSGQRHVSDYYVTPQKDISNFFHHFLQDEKIERPDRLTWLDPCCGGDAKNKASYSNLIETELGAYCDTVDIRKDSKAEIIGNYLNLEFSNYDIIISNPPFSHALDFIKKAMGEIKEGGHVIMLLRLNFLGSAKRFDFFSEHMSKSIYVHHKRISFTNGKTDSIEYAHFVWQKGHRSNYSKTFLI